MKIVNSRPDLASDLVVSTRPNPRVNVGGHRTSTRPNPGLMCLQSGNVNVTGPRVNVAGHVNVTRPRVNGAGHVDVTGPRVNVAGHVNVARRPRQPARTSTHRRGPR